MSEEHIAVHCRVCGSRFKNKKARRYSCSDKRVDLLEVFGIDVNDDVDEIHPQATRVATLFTIPKQQRTSENTTPGK